ncbi:MAG: 30S ribosomal protein S4e [Candidatus Thorarchaeota archaeon]|nr:MAG: 30S ribosomal protein S4e [Candidatus Thorarchaeota archaeon]
MARRGQKKHLKRLPAPRHWPIKRKWGKFATRVIPGPHPKEHSLTLAILLREVLGHAENLREVKAILTEGQVSVDGRIRKDPRYPIGLMDIVEIKNSEEKYRLLPQKGGGLRLVAVDDAETKYKLCRIERKQMVPGGRLQLTLHDGRNILIPKDGNPSDYKTLDTLQVSLPDQKLMATIPLENGVYAVVTRGRNIGIEGKVLEIAKRFGTHASTVTIEDPEGNRFQTALDYVFAVGKRKSKVSLHSAGGAE